MDPMGNIMGGFSTRSRTSSIWIIGKVLGSGGEKPICSRAGHVSDIWTPQWKFGDSELGNHPFFWGEGMLVSSGKVFGKGWKHFWYVIPQETGRKFTQCRLLLKGFKQLFMVAWCGNNRCLSVMALVLPAGLVFCFRHPILLNLAEFLWILDPLGLYGLYG